jgi:alkanesulfonate monooxygenase SsuD/methylene tetrahydromethanopterin reductase-like flavin-dependent oxidoreductase (luciferase family)
VKRGVQIVDVAWEGGPAGMAETLVRIARTADDAGFDVIDVADHLWQGAHMGWLGDCSLRSWCRGHRVSG